MSDNDSKSSIQVIARMMSLMEALARHTAPVNLKALAIETELHPSTAHRILSVMVQYRMVDRIEPGTYQLGMRLFELGTLVRSRIPVCHEALPYMQQLQQMLGETVNLSVRHADEVIYVERASSGNPSIPPLQVPGARAPLHTTAMGKIFLAADGPDKCLEYARRTGLPQFTEKTLTDHVHLLKQVEEARRQGYAFDHEEASKGVSCVGTGIYDREGRLIAALSVSAPSERFNKGWASQVKQASERISRALGNPLTTVPPNATAWSRAARRPPMANAEDSLAGSFTAIRITQRDASLELYFPPLRAVASALMLAVFGLSCGVIAGASISGLLHSGDVPAASLLALAFAGVFALPLGALGLWFIAVAIGAAANSMTVQIDASGLRVNRGMCGYTFARHEMHRDELTALELVLAPRYLGVPGGMRQYRIRARAPGNSLIIADNLKGPMSAAKIRRMIADKLQRPELAPNDTEGKNEPE